MSCSAVSVNRLMNGVEELLVTKRLREKVHGPSLQGLHRHWHVPMGADEYDLGRRIHVDELALKIKAAQSRQSHVEDKAARCVGAFGAQEFLGRLERVRSEAHRVEESREGVTHRWVIVDDKHDRVIAAHGL